MLLGQSPGGWPNAPWTGIAAGSAMPALSALDRFGPYRPQPYSLQPAAVSPALARPVPVSLPAAIEAWRQQQLRRRVQAPRSQPMGDRPGAMQRYAAMQDPQAAYLLYLNQQAAQRRPLYGFPDRRRDGGGECGRGHGGGAGKQEAPAAKGRSGFGGGSVWT